MNRTGTRPAASKRSKQKASVEKSVKQSAAVYEQGIVEGLGAFWLSSLLSPFLLALLGTNQCPYRCRENGLEATAGWTPGPSLQSNQYGTMLGYGMISAVCSRSCNMQQLVPSNSDSQLCCTFHHCERSNLQHAESQFTSYPWMPAI